MKAKQGSFTAPTSAATNTVVTGLGFQPKALIVWSNGQTATGFAAGSQNSFGFGTGSALSAQRCIGPHDADNVSTTDSARSHADGVLYIPPSAATATPLWFARILSFDSDGFTLDWVNVSATGIIVHFLALGGTDLTNAEVIQFQNTPADVNGNQTYPCSFVPDLMLYASAAFATAPPAAGVTSNWLIGAGMSSTSRWAIGMRCIDGQTMASGNTSKKIQRGDRISVGPLGTSVDSEGDLVSFNATPSITINWINAPGATNYHFALLLKGGSYHIGRVNKSTSAAPVTQSVTSPGFRPAAVLLPSFCNPTSTLVQADAEVALGAFDEFGNEHAVWFQNKDAVLPANANRATVADKAIRIAESDATVESEADGSMRSDGFDLNWTTNLTTKADEICYVAFGPAEVDVGPTSVRFVAWIGDLF